VVVAKCPVHLSNYFSDLIRLPNLVMYPIAFLTELSSVTILCKEMAGITTERRQYPSLDLMCSGRVESQPHMIYLRRVHGLRLEVSRPLLTSVSRLVLGYSDRPLAYATAKKFWKYGGSS
jgi:hypothetical protein